MILKHAKSAFLKCTRFKTYQKYTLLLFFAGKPSWSLYHTTHQLLSTILRVLEASLEDHHVNVGLGRAAEPPPATTTAASESGADVASDEAGLESHQLEADETGRASTDGYGDGVEDGLGSEHGAADQGQGQGEGLHDESREFFVVQKTRCVWFWKGKV